MAGAGRLCTMMRIARTALSDRGLSVSARRVSMLGHSAVVETSGQWMAFACVVFVTLIVNGLCVRWVASVCVPLILSKPVAAPALLPCVAFGAMFYRLVPRVFVTVWLVYACLKGT